MKPQALSALSLRYAKMFLDNGLLASEDIRSLLEGIALIYSGCRDESTFSRTLSWPLPPEMNGGIPENTGMTPHQYRIQERIQTAKKLPTGATSIADAALMAGFCDQGHLNRWFNKSVGITPHRYKDSCFFLDV